MTEITDNKEKGGWILYDATCPFCRALARPGRALLARRGFDFLPLQTPWVKERLALSALDLQAEMRVLTHHGRIHGGAAGVLYLAGFVWWAAPLRWLARSPRAMSFLEHRYRWIARRRSCAGQLCQQPTSSWRLKWLPFFLLPLFATIATSHLPAWTFMWALASAIFLGCKWVTWRDAFRPPFRAMPGRSLGYLFLWPGMDPDTFLDRTRSPNKPRLREWAEPALKTALGAVLVWGIAHHTFPERPLLAGWVGMVGLILLLHFGSFHLIALSWQTVGVMARPIMRRPGAARSVSEFWSSRWNRGFNDLARRHIAEPLRRKGHTLAPIVLPFLASGLIHELVISLPARGGYGLPTAYFILQAGGVLMERSPLGKTLRLRRGMRGWLFTLLVTAAPLGALFHPPFVSRVMLPFLKAIGAL